MIPSIKKHDFEKLGKGIAIAFIKKEIYMKTFMLVLVPILLSITLSGCYKYQHFTLSSDIKQNKDREFVIENDTLQLKYHFDGIGGHVQIYAFNKLDKPIYIDWTKSSIIIGDKSQSYVTGQAVLKGTVNGYGYGFNNNAYRYGNTVSSYRGNIYGTIQTETNSSFVPPKTYIEERRLAVRDNFMVLDPASKHRVDMVTKTGMSSGKYANFSETASPLQFRSYLTLSLNEDLSHSFHFENRFWATEVIETTSAPYEMESKPNNQFYTRKSTGAGETIWVIGLIALIAIAAANAHH
jgi:hypothetical protein